MTSSTSSKLVHVCLGAMAAALIAAAFYTHLIIERRPESLETFSRYKVAHSANQAAVEFQRFQKSLLVFSRTHAADDLDEAMFRYKTLRKRTEVLEHGEFAQFTATDPRLQRVVADLQAEIKGLDFSFIGATSDLDVRPILEKLAPLEAPIAGLAADVYRYGAERLSSRRQSLQQLHRQFSGLSFGLVACGLFLVAALTWHNRLLTRAHKQLASASRAVETANAELRRQNIRLSG